MHLVTILHGNIATGTFHYSEECLNVRKCHPDTCAAVLAEIMQRLQDIAEIRGYFMTL